MPTGWKVFVAPQPGATGELESDRAFSGRNCVKLHIPTPYAVEPANNWSQPLPLAKTGVRVTVRAHIKTTDATEAAIWLQCFQRDPWMVLKQVSSSTDSPVYGTMDWTPVEFNTLIPQGTDYAMIRCVLKGHGTAWFDDVTVDFADSNADDSPASKEPAKRVTPIEATPPAPESISPPTPKPIPTQPASTQPRTTTTVIANEKLRQSNEQLALQLQQLQTEIAALRAVLKPPLAKSETERTPPPLVPHGFQWEEGQE